MNARQFIARCFNTTASDSPSSAPTPKATPQHRTTTFDFVKQSSATILDQHQTAKVKGGVGGASESDVEVVSLYE